MPNVEDNCPVRSNRDQTNTDGDGQGDDGDHVRDTSDDCPTQQGTAANRGCPEQSQGLAPCPPDVKPEMFPITSIGLAADGKLLVARWDDGAGQALSLPSGKQEDCWVLKGGSGVTDIEATPEGTAIATLNGQVTFLESGTVIDALFGQRGAVY